MVQHSSYMWGYKFVGKKMRYEKQVGCSHGIIRPGGPSFVLI